MENKSVFVCSCLLRKDQSGAWRKKKKNSEKSSRNKWMVVSTDIIENNDLA